MASEQVMAAAAWLRSIHWAHVVGDKDAGENTTDVLRPLAVAAFDHLTRDVAGDVDTWADWLRAELELALRRNRL